MSKIIVANRAGGTLRAATKQETCRHWMIPTNASSGGQYYRRCSFCGISDAVPHGTKPDPLPGIGPDGRLRYPKTPAPPTGAVPPPPTGCFDD